MAGGVVPLSYFVLPGELQARPGALEPPPCGSEGPKSGPSAPKLLLDFFVPLPDVTPQLPHHLQHGHLILLAD